MSSPEIAEETSPRGVRRWLLSCTTTHDETGPHGVGILWMNWQRRGDFQALVRTLRERTDAPGPWTWGGVNAARVAGAEAFVEAFFATHWLSFDAFIVSRPEKGAPASDAEAAGHAPAALCTGIADQVRQRLRAEPHIPQTFRLWLDAKETGFPNRRTAARTLRSHALVPLLGHRPLQDKIIGHRLSNTPSLQLCDLLLGAVFAAWQGKVTLSARRGVQDRIAAHLGWQDLRTESRPGGTKFNVRALTVTQGLFQPMQLGLFDQLRSSRRGLRPAGREALA